MVATVYAPISYGPLPLLAFKCTPGRTPMLAAAGALRSVDPDRVVLKKIVLTGYPARCVCVRVCEVCACVRVWTWACVCIMDACIMEVCIMY
jgi:hypothetical protein